MGNNCFTTSHVHHQEINVKNESTLKQNQCISLEEGCECINRMHSALRYYSSLNLDHSQHAENKLVKYCNMTYKLLLNDYVHIVTNHNSDTDLHKIFNLLTASDDYIECTIAKCTLSSRHYRDRNVNNINKSKVESNKDFMFYRDILDSMHCFLFHLYDFGLRIKNSSENNYHAQGFENMYDHINSKIQILQNLGVFDVESQNNKFCFKTTETDTIEITFIDSLYTYMNEQSLSNEEIQKLNHIIISQEYESEAIMDDVSDDYTNSNLNLLVAKKCFSLLEKYTHQTKICDNSFSIGFVFYYWTHYKKEVYAPEKRETPGQINDHSGYEPYELYVEAKYRDIKEEILNNNIYWLTLDQFEISYHKSNKYISSAITKQIKAGRADWLHYNITTGATVSASNLLAIILYCDWSKLSEAFSKTFRKIKNSESITDVKTRNREYAIWSKVLRETVQLFGQKGWTRAFDDEKRNNEWNNENNRVQGPFFSGMSKAMIIPEFNIRLCGPSSTSRHIEVATRFAEDKGIIIQLNNNGDYHAASLRSFNCSWISNYAGEDEQLFIGGDRRIKIESIINIVTKENFEEFFRPLFYFHCMVNGARMEQYEPEITDIDYIALNNLIQHTVGINGFCNQYPSYIIDTFMAFTNHTKQIVINLHEIHSHFNKLKGLILYDNKDKGNNMFKEILFQLFKNLNHIIIYSTSLGFSDDEYKTYPFKLLSLLNIICSSNSFISKHFHITIKATHDYSQSVISKSWIFDAVSDFTRSKFEERKLNLELTQTMGASNKNEDLLIISF
eukprot:152733_1